jgi:hypothetical protein
MPDGLLEKMAATLIGTFVGWLLGLSSKELQDWLTKRVRGPLLSAAFDEQADCMTLTPETYFPDVSASAVSTKPQTRVVCFARVRITNTKPRPALKCRAFLSNVEQLKDGKFVPTAYHDSIPLTWSFNAEIDSVDIPKGVRRYLDVVRIQSDQKGFDPQFRPKHIPLMYQHIFREYGTYRFTVVLSADDIAPVSVEVPIQWTGDWPPKVVL